MGTQKNQRVLLTDMKIKALKPAETGKRYVVWDVSVPHLCVRVTDKGAKSFRVKKRMAGAKNPVEMVLGTYPALSLIDARKHAREVLGRIAEGIDPKKAERKEREEEVAKAKNNFEAVAELFKEKYAKFNRSGKETGRIIDLYLTPTFGKTPMHEITRGRIAKLLNELSSREFKDKHGRFLGGTAMAGHVKAQLRKLLNWYAANNEDFGTLNEDFINPIVKGMAYTKPKKRKNTLDEDEIRALWAALDVKGPDNKRATPDLWAAYVKVLFLSAQRRDEVAGMMRSEIIDSMSVPKGKKTVVMRDIWIIPPERHKTGDDDNEPLWVPLPKAALAIIRDVPQINDSDLIFTTNGETPFSGFSKSKARIDTHMLAELRKVATKRNDAENIAKWDEIEGLLISARKGDVGARETLKKKWWTLHDLRRTAKTLMARVGVLPHISEQVLGHVIKGVEGDYDQFKYLAEKRDALEKLAALIEKIVGAPLAGATAGKKKRP